MIPERGAVLGIDVGFSAAGRTTGLCLLTWDEDALTWQTAVTGTAENMRIPALHQLLEKVDEVMAVAIDGPLRPNLVCVREYRCAESLLARGLFQHRGKPGASHFGVGWDLHRAATTMAKLVVRVAGVQPGVVVEAFPNAFLAVLHDDDGFPCCAAAGRRWTDVLYGRPAMREALERVLAQVAPGRTVLGDWDFADSGKADAHEQRSALVCALTALCVAAKQSVSVGATADGFIHLPPRSVWGCSTDGGTPWAEAALRHNVRAACSERPPRWDPVVDSDGSRWLPE